MTNPITQESLVRAKEAMRNPAHNWGLINNYVASQLEEFLQAMDDAIIKENLILGFNPLDIGKGGLNL